MDLPATELTLRMLVAAGLGAAIGFEREAASRGAGARTVTLVALGSALFTLAGAYGFSDSPTAGSTDPGRIAAQVATGVGFIGAGAILRDGTSVLGLTTAASVWLAAAVGVLVAAGGYVTATIGTLIALAVLVGLRLAKPLLWRFTRVRSILSLEYDLGHGTLGPLLDVLNQFGADLEDLDIDDDRERGLRRVELRIRMPRGTPLASMAEAIRRHPDVRQVTAATSDQD